MLIMHGQSYARVIPGGNQRSPINWYVRDPLFRIRAASELRIPASFVTLCSEMLEKCNALVKHLKEYGQQNVVPQPEAQIVVKWDVFSDEIGIITQTSGADSHEDRCIIIYTDGTGRGACVSSLHPLYESLRYPLLFFNADRGWGPDLRHIIPEKYWYRQHILRSPRFVAAGRLLAEYSCDACSNLLFHRLQYLRHLYKTKTITTPNALRNNDVLMQKRWLPASITGSPQYFKKQQRDALAIVQKYGKPTYFITVTCNKNWEEFKILPPHIPFTDRPGLVCRVFNLRMKRLIALLTSDASPLGRYVYYILQIEFQKRGPPHGHLAIKVINEPRTPHGIDQVISAVVPPVGDRNRDRVLKCMVHHCTSYCLRPDGTCRKGFPQELALGSYIDFRGFVHHKRTKSTTNSHYGDDVVLEHSPALLEAWDGHIHVRVAYTVECISYLFKYIFKRDTPIQFGVSSADHADEITEFQRGRYMGAAEAFWTGPFGFPITDRKPGVLELPVHLEGGEPILVDREHDAAEVLGCIAAKVSLLERYFVRPNHDFLEAGAVVNPVALTYAAYFELFSISNTMPKKCFAVSDGHATVPCFVYLKPRGTNGEVRTVTRVTHLFPDAGEVFYLRQLLIKFPASSYEDARNFNGKVHNTYKDTCAAAGLLFDDVDHHHSVFESMIQENITPREIRYVFALLVAYESVPYESFFEKYASTLAADFIERLTVEQYGAVLEIHGLAFYRTQEALKQLLEDMNFETDTLPFPKTLPRATDAELWNPGRSTDAHVAVYKRLKKLLKPDHKRVLHVIEQSSSHSEQVCLYIDGYAGSGKTLTLNCITAFLRSLNKVVVCIAPTGLASLNHEGGGTCHSLFRIEISTSSVVNCKISLFSSRAAFLHTVEYIIWDELANQHRKDIEAVHRILCTLMGTSFSVPFGGENIISGGDARQIPPPPLFLLVIGSMFETRNYGVQNFGALFPQCN